MRDGQSQHRGKAYVEYVVDATGVNGTQVGRGAWRKLIAQVQGEVSLQAMPGIGVGKGEICFPFGWIRLRPTVARRQRCVGGGDG